VVAMFAATSDNLHNVDLHHHLAPNMRVGSSLLVTLLIFPLMVGCIGDEKDPSKECDTGIDYEPLVPDPFSSTVANVRLADWDSDGIDEAFYTMPLDGVVSLLDCDSTGCDETTISLGITAPVRTHVVDLDSDGALDLVVSDIGILSPDDSLVGKVVTYWGSSGIEATPEVIIDGIGRTVCAESGDFDGDGDLDLVVCEFGNMEGSVFWLEQVEDGEWIHHEMDNRSGAIHAFPFDADGDGDLDIAVSLSQTSEEVDLFLNDGTGNFSLKKLVESDDIYYGMSGLEVVDIDSDGDYDIIYSNGDTLDMDVPEGVDPHELHGVSLLENDGEGNFTEIRLLSLWGSYVGHASDLDGDGDMDILVGTMQIDYIFPNTDKIDLVVLENIGQREFITHEYENAVRYLITMDTGDIDGDGEIDILSGSHRLGLDGQAHRSIELTWHGEEVCLDG